MTLGDFYTLVRKSIGRGTSLDGLIPSYVKMAALWLERNYEFIYMEELGAVSLKPGDRVLEFPKVNIRSFRFIRLIDSGEFSYLNKISAEQLDAVGVGSPNRYYRVGTNKVVLDNTPEEEETGESLYYKFTDWPQADDDTAPLLTIAHDVLLLQTMLVMAPTVLRNSKLTTEIKVLRDEALTTLTYSEDDGRYQGYDLRMAYVPERTR